MFCWRWLLWSLSTCAVRAAGGAVAGIATSQVEAGREWEEDGWRTTEECGVTGVVVWLSAVEARGKRGRVADEWCENCQTRQVATCCLVPSSCVRRQSVVAMSSTLENQILSLQERLRAENESRDRDRQSNEIAPGNGLQPSSSGPTSSPALRRPRQREFSYSEDLPVHESPENLNRDSSEGTIIPVAISRSGYVDDPHIAPISN